MPDLAGTRVRLRLFQTGPSFFLSFFFRAASLSMCCLFGMCLFFPLVRSPFCSSSQNETRNLERKKKKEQNVCRAIVWSRIGRELDGTALMASKRPKPKPPLEARRRHHQQHHRRTQEWKKGTRGGIQPVDRRLPLAFAKQSSLLLPPFFRLSLPKRQQRFFRFGRWERERGGGVIYLRRRRSRDVEVPYNKRVSYLSGWRGKGEEGREGLRHR